MSKLFFDHLVVLDDVDFFVKKTAQTKEEREELWQLIDEIIHHRVFDTILDKLPKEHHQEFLEMFHDSPHNEGIIDYLKERIGENVEELIKQEIGGLSSEILESIKDTKK